MRIADVMKNDIVDCDNGFCVSVWLQGCPYHCKGCHNPQTWDFNSGKEIKNENKFIEETLSYINENGIERNLSLLGGEPLCKEGGNVDFSYKLLKAAKEKYPNIKTYVWTGSTYEKLKKEINNDIFNYIDILIDGPFILEQRDITLPLRGSSNQRVINIQETIKQNKIITIND